MKYTVALFLGLAQAGSINSYSYGTTDSCNAGLHEAKQFGDNFPPSHAPLFGEDSFPGYLKDNDADAEDCVSDVFGVEDDSTCNCKCKNNYGDDKSIIDRDATAVNAKYESVQVGEKLIPALSE